MLNNTNKLFFPKLKYDSSDVLMHNNNEEKIINLYSLDWQRKETKSNNKLSDLNYELDDKIKSLRFAISDGYMKEIQRVSWNSINELNQQRNIDKSLKGIYLLPTSAYVEEAFRLLSDCIYDTEQNFYYRKPDKIVIPYILLYKFWSYQVSKSLLFEFTRIPQLITLSMNDTITMEQSTEINRFLTFVDSDILGAKDE